MYMYSAINLINSGKQLMMAHALGNPMHLHELGPPPMHLAGFHAYRWRRFQGSK